MNNLIEFFALCGAIAFFCGFAEMWAFLASFIFVGAAMTCAILRNGCKE